MSREQASGVKQLRVVLRADDFDAALAFYRDSLGLAELAAFQGAGDASDEILEAGRATLELANEAQVDMIDTIEVGRSVSPKIRLAFEVDDTAATTSDLQRAGATLVAAPVETPWRSLNSRLDTNEAQLTLFQELDSIVTRRSMDGFSTAAARTTDLDRATVDRLLTTTRSVRRRLDLERTVDLDVVARCLELAFQAPSAADQQNWRWVVIVEPQLRARVAELYRAANSEFLQAQLATLDAGPERRRIESAAHLAEHLAEVPVLVAAYVVEPDLAGLGDASVPPVLLYGSVFPAVWSFQLALRSRGLGTVPLYVSDEVGLAELLGAPEGAHLAALMPIAHHTGDDFQPARRRPLADVVGWDSWGGPAPVARSGAQPVPEPSPRV
jgi:nitroreductase/catechol 2,3-dioxygenase-like lactoylglutathione lyase family enzyme